MVPDDVADVLVVAGPAQSYRDNVHEEVKLLQVTGSGFTVRRRGRTQHAAPGQLVVLHADDAHTGSPDDADAARWRIMCLAPALIAEVLPPSALRFDDVAVADTTLGNGFSALYELLSRPGGGPGAALRREAAVLRFVSGLSKRADGGGAPAGPGAAGRAPEVVREYLRANLVRNVVTAPLLIVHGRGDQAIPLADAEAAYAAAPEPKELLVLDTENHIDLYDDDTYVLPAVERAVDFFDRSH